MPEAPSIRPASVVLAISATILLLVSTFLAGSFGAPPTPFHPSAPRLLLELTITATIVVIFVMVGIIIMLLNEGRLRDEPLARLCVVCSGSCLLVLLLIINVQALWHDDYIASHEAEFHAKFNDLVCDLRGTEVCANGGTFDQMRAFLASAAANITPRLDTSTSAREYCMVKLLRGREVLRQHQQDFLDSLMITDAVDKWCGSKMLGLPTHTTSPFSPVSMNSATYGSLRTTPVEEVRSVTIAMGSALVCMALLYLLESSGKGKVKKAHGGLHRVKKD